MNYFKVVACLILLLSSAPPSLAKVYTWTDEKGVKHFSNIAPPDSAENLSDDEEIRVEPADSTPASSGAEATGPSQQSPPAEDSQIDEDTEADLEEPEPPEQAAEQKAPPAEESAPADEQALSQGEIVANEKARVKQLQTELENDQSKRDEFIASEKERLMQTLESIRQMPTSEFGSRRNKDRQLGYYQYRLEALQNNPDTYFQYGESDSD